MKRLKVRLMSPQGFTLIEIMIALLLMTVILGILFVSFNMVNSNWHFDSDLVSLRQQVRLAQERMTREIRQSRAVDVNITNQGADIAFAVGGVSINYYLDGAGNIIRHDADGNDLTVANSISNLHFNLAGNTVSIAVTGANNGFHRNLTFDLTEEVYLRNQ